MAALEPGIGLSLRGPKGEMLYIQGETYDQFTELGKAVLDEDVFKLAVGGVVDHVMGASSEQFDKASQAVQSEFGKAPGLSNQAPASNGGPSCQHGARTTRNGTSARGPWTGHFCPLPKGDANQCKPIFEN